MDKWYYDSCMPLNPLNVIRCNNFHNDLLWARRLHEEVILLLLSCHCVGSWQWGDFFDLLYEVDVEEEVEEVEEVVEEEEEEEELEEVEEEVW